MDNSQNKLQLGYWAIRGLAERIRMILEYLEIPYEEIKYNNQEEDKWFNEDKLKLIGKNPAVNLPYLIDGDKVISESDAIIAYICLKANRPDMLGSNCQEQVLAATTMGVFRDYHKNYILLVYGTKEDFENENQRNKKISLWKPQLTKLNLLLEGKEYFCGKITWVDFVVAENMQAVNLLDSQILKEFPNLLHHQQRIWNLPQLQAYHQSQRWQQRPVNYNPDACWY